MLALVMFAHRAASLPNSPLVRTHETNSLPRPTARMDDATPADDVAERQEEREEASEPLAPAPTARTRADKKKARAESARIANGGRRGPGLSTPTPVEQRRGRAFQKREAKRQRNGAQSW